MLKVCTWTVDPDTSFRMRRLWYCDVRWRHRWRYQSTRHGHFSSNRLVSDIFSIKVADTHRDRQTPRRQTSRRKGSGRLKLKSRASQYMPWRLMNSKSGWSLALWKSCSFKKRKIKVKEAYNSSCGNHLKAAIRAHSYIVTCHPTQMNANSLNPSQASWYSIYLPRRDGRLSWPRCMAIQEPALCGRKDWEGHKALVGVKHWGNDRWWDCDPLISMDKSIYGRDWEMKLF